MSDHPISFLKRPAYRLAFLPVALIGSAVFGYLEHPRDGYWLDYAREMGAMITFTIMFAAALYGIWEWLSQKIGDRPFIKSVAVTAMIFAVVFFTIDMTYRC